MTEFLKTLLNEGIYVIKSDKQDAIELAPNPLASAEPTVTESIIYLSLLV